MTDWRVRGDCREHDPELFFPFGTSGPALLQQAEAKRVCIHCPVQRECLRTALNKGEEFGVWGASSEFQRRDMLRTPDSPIKSTKATDLEPGDVDWVLAQLDQLVPLTEVAEDTGVSQQLCRAIWRQHRPTAAPPFSTSAPTSTQEDAA